MRVVVLVMLGVIIFPVYLYFVILFAYLGKVAGLRIMMTKALEYNRSKKEQGEENNG